MSKDMRKDAAKITVSLEAHKLVRTQRDDGGYRSGYCIVCERSGWSNGPDCFASLGAAAAKKGGNNQLIHEADCPVGRWIDAAGED